MITRTDGLTIVTTREQFAERRAEAELRRQQELDDRPHGIFIWSMIMLVLAVGIVAGYLIGHARG